MQAAKKKIHEICCSHLQHEKIFRHYPQIKIYKKLFQTAEKKLFMKFVAVTCSMKKFSDIICK